jgi:hypothetical protein
MMMLRTKADARPLKEHLLIDTVLMQMGGKEGVREREQDLLTHQPQGGMLMHALPRVHRIK